MDNQHRKIKGYRELSQVDIDLMNKVKELGFEIQVVLAHVREHIAEQRKASAQLYAEQRAQSIHDTGTEGPETHPEQNRLGLAEPEHWLGMARTDLQTGLMKLTRAVAQPTFF
jgi:hypothetical protein